MLLHLGSFITFRPSTRVCRRPRRNIVGFSMLRPFARSLRPCKELRGAPFMLDLSRMRSC